MSKKAGQQGDKHLTQAQAATFRDKIQSVILAGRTTSIDLCQMVWESDVTMVRVNGDLKYCWQTWGYTSWEDFLGKEMDLHLKTAYGLRKVWQVFYVDLLNDWNKELLLGLTKMRLLTRMKLTPTNVESKLRKARDMTCAKLLAMVSDQEERRSFAVKITATQMNSLVKSLELLRATLPKGETMTRGDLLVHMARMSREASSPRLRAA
jgi:predicted DNA-binding ribbon-helix-helix protein